MKKIVSILFLFALFIQFTVSPAFGAQEYDYPKVALEIVLQNDGCIRYDTGKYSFIVKRNETRPETVQVWKGSDDLKSHFNIVDGTATDKLMEGTRPITKSEATAWKQEWEKIKKAVRVMDVGPHMDMITEYGRVYEFTSRATTGAKGEDVYVLKYASEDGGGTRILPMISFKYRPPIGKKFGLGIESGLYVPIVTGADGKKFIPLD